MIMEPYHAPSAQFHRETPTVQRIREIKERFPDIPLCIDEIQGGFGRTGRLFGHQWYKDLRPDFVTIGKACGGGLPLSALLGPKEIMESKVVRENAHLSSTHSGNPVMCAVGIEVIKQIQKHNLIVESYRKGLLLDKWLRDCGVRVHSGRGLLAGLEFKNEAEASHLVKKCQGKGLLVVETGRKWVKIGPPFVISEEDLEKACNILKEAIEETINKRKEK